MLGNRRVVLQQVVQFVAAGAPVGAKLHQNTLVVRPGGSERAGNLLLAIRCLVIDLWADGRTLTSGAAASQQGGNGGGNDELFNRFDHRLLCYFRLYRRIEGFTQLKRFYQRSA